MFTTLIVRPIFNLLVLIQAVIPGHSFGLSIIIFTIVIRMLMWPLVKKQLRQAKAMRELQPEIKRIKKASKGNRPQESKLLMELYKEREISPFGSIGTLIIQFIILIGLYSGLRKVVYDPKEIVTFSYPILQHLGWLKELAGNIHNFHSSLFGLVDLNKSALNKAGGGIYWPAMIIVLGSVVTQYFQAKQLMPSNKSSRKLRDILKEAGNGKQTDQSEVNAAVGRGTRFFLPGIIFLVTINYPSAISLYWLVGGLVAFLQQSYVLREDTVDMEAIADKKPSKNVAEIAEAEIIEQPKPSRQSKKSRAKAQGKKRKR